MKKLITRYGWLLVVVGAIVAFYAYGKTRPIEVQTTVVARGPIEETITDEAQTQLDVDRLIVADRAGTLRRITLEEGDAVSEGQVLCSIEDTELRLSIGILRDQLAEVDAQLAGVDVPLPKPAEVEAAEREVALVEAGVEATAQERRAAEADLAFAEAEFERISNLVQSHVATEQQRDSARRNLDVARATLDAVTRRLEAERVAVQVAKLRRAALDQRMQDTAHLHRAYEAQMDGVRKSLELLTHEATVRSPIDGVVLEKHLDSEQFVQPGTPLLRVGDTGTIEIRADILSDDVGRVRNGQKAYLVGRAVRTPDAEGRVRKVYPSGFTKVSSLGVQEQRVSVLIGFDNAELGLQPGYELDVKIVVETRDDVVLVPAEAVFATAEGAAVFVVENGRSALRPVVTGLTGEHHYEIVEGLREGDTVILRPPADLEPGARVVAAAGQ